MTRAHARGIALVELIIAIVLISITAATVFGQVRDSAGVSAAGVITAQSESVANAYLQLIARRPVDDPDGVDGELLRANFDDVDDYNGILDVGARDASGALIAGLGNLTVRVSVVATNALPGVAAADARRIDVTVDDATGTQYLATAFRLRP
jgi:MSHA pilin protein MshD